MPKAPLAKDQQHFTRYNGVRVAVLAASGFIGRWVARALCAQGANVYLVVRDGPRAESVFSDYQIRGITCETDLTDSRKLNALLQRIGPSIIFNLAGYGVDPSERDERIAYQVNAELVNTVCGIVAETRNPDWVGQDLVHVGSALEYGAIGGNLAEDSIPNPTTLYGKSKLTGTQLLSLRCKEHKIKGLTARLFTVYGPGERAERLLPSLLETAMMRRPLSLTAGSQRRDFTYVGDVADGLLRLGISTAAPGEVVNLATGRLSTVRSFAQTAAEVLGIPSNLLSFGALPTRAEEMEHAPVAVERLHKFVDWIPSTTVADGIRRTWEFEKQHSRRMY